MDVPLPLAGLAPTLLLKIVWDNMLARLGEVGKVLLWDDVSWTFLGRFRNVTHFGRFPVVA